MASQSAAWYNECQWLGEGICGYDWDDLLSYQTPKMAKIKDRSLGLIHIGLSCLVFCYIVLYQILYLGSHFTAEHVLGVHRLQWQHPTRNGCSPKHKDCEANFTAFKDAPYCQNHTQREAGAVGVVTCAYRDAYELPMRVPSGVLLPTFVALAQQTSACERSAAECSSGYRYQQGFGRDAPLQTDSGNAEQESNFFIVDVEYFTVLIDHSFTTPSGSQAHSSAERKMPGYWLDCSGGAGRCARRPIRSIHDGLSAEEKLETVWSVGPGDVLSVKTMLRIAKASRNGLQAPPGGYSFDDILKEGNTRRHKGAVVVLSIDYENVGHWRLLTPRDPPSYTISVTMEPAGVFKHIHTKELLGGRQRDLYQSYGLMIVVQQSGDIVRLVPLHVLVVLSTAVGMFAVARIATDKLMSIMPKRAQYVGMKYDVSADMVHLPSDGHYADASGAASLRLTEENDQDD